MLVNIKRNSQLQKLQKLSSSPETYAKNRVDQIRQKINSRFKNNQQDKDNQFKSKQVFVDKEDNKFQFSLSSLHQIKSVQISKVTNSLTCRQESSTSQRQKLQRKISEIFMTSREDDENIITSSRKDRMNNLNSINNRIKQALNQRCISRFANISLSTNKKPQKQQLNIKKQQRKTLITKQFLGLQQKQKQNYCPKKQDFDINKNMNHRQDRKGKYLKTIQKNLESKAEEKINDQIVQKRILKQRQIQDQNSIKDQSVKKSPFKYEPKQKLQQKSNQKQMTSNRKQQSKFKISQNLSQLKRKVQKKQTLKLAHVLSTQIQKQSVLKQKRWRFINLATQNKWQKLRKLMPAKSLQHLKVQIQIPAQEHDPFFQSQKHTDQTCISALVQAYKQSLQNWNRFVKKSVQQQILEQESFRVKDMDLNLKGFLSVEDLVCFVNLYTGQYFRNRDIASLMRRFIKESQIQSNCKQLKIQYSQFMKTVSIKS